jgi:hypothetical protein
MREMRCKEKELRVVARRERGCWLPCRQRDKMSQVEIFYIHQEREWYACVVLRPVLPAPMRYLFVQIGSVRARGETMHGFLPSMVDIKAESGEEMEPEDEDAAADVELRAERRRPPALL